ncbi:GspE/PulE family protein (plasmid) [Pseudomonas cannabina pv. alisalensis]|uniref:Type II/IV secretion system protein n=1 Tax=Pseudomonas syringae pv. maculicola str. ES4326 TaxID=629265 RepID=A0A8T8CAT1_PSEYM|nr:MULTISPECIES: GspE/PulE family protein [Pseudomonas syringae group]QHF00595.1 type II/IV secretion system protein [Pseudomonas syringae pv. maculicola str. ES4326]UBZ00584.1 GspE/PulE family protein [Pseudomonas cannabina pv. alisalensis]
MSTENTRGIELQQKKILNLLVSEGKITNSQAQSLPPSESVESIIPDIARMTNNEDALVAAVATALSRPAFVEVEEGRKAILPGPSENFCVYDGIVYLTNPLDQRSIQRALTWARQKKNEGELKTEGDLRIGVIGAAKLDGLRNTVIDDDEVVTADGEQAKQLAAKRIDDMIREAASKDATDIHLQPTQGDRVQVRYRIDGDLRTQRTYLNTLHDSICRVAIETRSNLILETGTAQDGKFSFDLTGNKKINLRLSSLPVQRGSDKALKLVLRLLGNNTKLSNLPQLGLSKRNEEIMRRLGNQPNGLIAVTGPTGSGKTTTLGAVLVDAYRNNPDRNYHTIEEPVEIQHEGMSHTECGKHLTFADALRALLRQDPDVILVGEMRDEETADLGYKAAQTGHLVLTTLHTNNAHESIARLERMNIPSDIIASNTSAFAAQRLVRRLCTGCRVEYRFKDSVKQASLYGLNQIFNGNTDVCLYRANPEGCEKCGRESGGMKGRAGILEVLEFTPDVQEAILSGVSPNTMRRSSIADGTFLDLWDDGLRLVKDGITSFEELEKHLRPYLTDRLAGSRAGQHAPNGALPLIGQQTPSHLRSQPQL